MIDNSAYLYSALKTIEAFREIEMSPYNEFIQYVDMIESDITKALQYIAPKIVVVKDELSITTTFPVEYDAKLKAMLRSTTWIFDRPGTENDDEAYHCHVETWKMARDILLIMCEQACRLDDGRFLFRPLPLPNFGPAGNGTIDLWWRIDSTWSLLLNITPHGYRSYFGSLPTGNIQGEFSLTDETHIKKLTEFLI